MRTIVETLELQHRAVEQEVVTLEHSLAQGQLEHIRASLDRMETMLTGHLKLENTEFYPPLLAKAEGDPAQQTVSLFQQNLARIGEGLLAFFKRWHGPLLYERLEGLKTDWAGILKLLGARLRDEDKILHPIYRRLFAR